MRRKFAEEDRKKQKKISYAAGLMEIETFLMLIIIYGWISNHGDLWSAGRPFAKIIYIIVILALVALAGVFAWAEVVHMNDYREQKRKIEALNEALSKERESTAYWKDRAKRNEET